MSASLGHNVPAALLAALQAAQSLLVISHVRPDGDAVGSLLAMTHMLRLLGKQATPALQDAVPEEYRVLPGAAEVIGPDAARSAGGALYDVVLVVDASSVDRMGSVYHDGLRDLPLLVIDHHITNTRFGSINWVAPEAAATCQMLVSLADALNLPLSPGLAQCLLTGLVTDTLCFRTNNTTPETLATGMRLMQNGAVLTDITEGMLDQRPLAVVRLWGLVLDHVRLEEGVIWATIPRAAFAAAGSTDSDDGSLSSMLIRTVGAEISASLLEKVDDAGAPQVECSFRARRGFDISAVALALGGGGHPAAGGCTVPGTLDEAVQRVIPLLKQARREQRAAHVVHGPL